MANIPAIRFKGFNDPWEQRKLGDEFAFLKNNTLSRAELSDSEGAVRNIHYGDVLIKFGSVLDASDPEIPRIMDEEMALSLTNDQLKDGDIVIADTAEDEAVGKCTELQRIGINKVVAGLHTIPLRPTERYAPGFLGHYLNSDAYHSQLKPLMQGIKVISISHTALAETRMTIPSFDEQCQIGALFSQLDTLITLHQRKYEKLSVLKKSLLEKMFPREGENKPEVRFAGFTDPWEQRKVSGIADRFDSLRVPVSANLRIPGTTPYYGANGIQDYVEGFTHEGEFVLVAEDGANDLKNYPVKCVNGRIWVNNHAHVLQSKPEIADNKFLAYSIGRANIEVLLVGGSRAKLNATAMMNIDLFCPGVREQVAIGSFFSQLDNLITLHQRKLEKLKQLKQSLLEKMFV